MFRTPPATLGCAPKRAAAARPRLTSGGFASPPSEPELILGIFHRRGASSAWRTDQNVNQCNQSDREASMSVFGNIVAAIFGKAKAAAGAIADAASGLGGPAKPEPMSRQELEAKIQKIADDTGRKNYNWKQSIVDLMKLLDIDSSLDARKQLAQELGYTGKLDGSAEMNVWLHKEVMKQMMENGGTVPEKLK
jgi:hypothetical protein